MAMGSKKAELVMKITITKPVFDISAKKALALALLADQEGLYYSHLDLTCSSCGWGVELHRNRSGKPAHFEHKNDNPKLCSFLR